MSSAYEKQLLEPPLSQWPAVRCVLHNERLQTLRDNARRRLAGAAIGYRAKLVKIGRAAGLFGQFHRVGGIAEILALDLAVARGVAGDAGIDADPAGSAGVFRRDAGGVDEISCAVAVSKNIGITTDAECARHKNVVLTIVQRHQCSCGNTGDTRCQKDGDRASKVPPEIHEAQRSTQITLSPDHRE